MAGLSGVSTADTTATSKIISLTLTGRVSITLAVLPGWAVVVPLGVHQPKSEIGTLKSDRDFSMRDRIAEVLYGDGDDLAWARAVQLADLIMWELQND